MDDVILIYFTRCVEVLGVDNGKKRAVKIGHCGCS